MQGLDQLVCQLHQTRVDQSAQHIMAAPQELGWCCHITIHPLPALCYQVHLLEQEVFLQDGMIVACISLQELADLVVLLLGQVTLGGSPEKTVEIQGSTLLEEYKNSKTRHFEPSNITGHVVEFRYVSMCST
jgi:hypothetical protein